MIPVETVPVVSCVNGPKIWSQAETAENTVSANGPKYGRYSKRAKLNCRKLMANLPPYHVHCIIFLWRVLVLEVPGNVFELHPTFRFLHFLYIPRSLSTKYLGLDASSSEKKTENSL
ncbi:hypothetical protein Leryth_007107 [Lithospermum erythrorhizon]|nr:hypothetical protein Leryth_007107 [Lithospermum erythrorhizon]